MESGKGGKVRFYPLTQLKAISSGFNLHKKAQYVCLT
jgi:hypothetical protein